MDTSSVGFAVAFTAGLLSFLSPCVLPLIPSYVTFITGLSLDDAQQARRSALVHALLFVLGFSLIFIALGAGATALGRVLIAYRGAITKVGGVLIVIFGLYLLGVFNVGLLARERRMHLADKPAGYLGTVLVGIAFGAGWTPCIGPILGAILTYNMSNADLSHGTALLAAYSLGLAVPFVVSALALRRFFDFFTRVRGKLLVLSRASGALLVLVGVLMVTNQFTRLATRLQALTPDAIVNRI
ncbi:cytochrome c biogenesis protein CcdA [Roseisolibacter sp. H3M3-2]|uniref:cytochrome c biogenesis CcdA family protein n=1 Tax=Roseisolibacter sp. H3M3-2 TaxID=3031323 RepID=UPI0023DBB269|nr:cytochrome c biogenesis protein CcdA [Roseisolibacter sp. H3M3-2]MDF1502141.1 cytochrome c biogenesis protein CcdA [Roseisolibacter sp. H3M3-2]